MSKQHYISDSFAVPVLVLKDPHTHTCFEPRIGYYTHNLINTSRCVMLKGSHCSQITCVKCLVSQFFSQLPQISVAIPNQNNVSNGRLIDFALHNVIWQLLLMFCYACLLLQLDPVGLFYFYLCDICEIFHLSLVENRKFQLIHFNSEEMKLTGPDVHEVSFCRI